MDDIGLQLTFSDPAASAAFAADLKAANFSGFRVATFEEKQIFDAETLIVVLKVLGAGIPALLAFAKFAREFLKKSDKPSVSLTYKDRTIELRGDASDEDVRRLCGVLIGTK